MLTGLCRGVVVCLALVLAAGSAGAATDINLKQSDGTKTLLGGVGSAANVNVVSGGGGTTSIAGCVANATAPIYVEDTENPASCDLAGNTRVSIGTLLSGEDQTNDLLMTSGGAVRLFTISTAGGMTTNATSATAVVHSGGKTPMASLTGTGALTGTVAFYGDMENTTTNGELICTLKLDATTKMVAYCPQFTRDFPYYHVVTTSITGTSATVVAQMAVGATGGVNAGFHNSAVVTSDTLVKTGAGLLQCVMIVANDSAPTAGTISILDAITAGGTPIAFSFFPTTTWFTPVQICPQRQMTYGIYIDFTTTADVSITVSYR